jgi:ABC-type sugar transport system substrate-binding protein
MKKLKILVSLIMEENHYQKQHEVAIREAARRMDVETELLYADKDAITQSEQLLKAIQNPSKENRPDGIICAPVGTTLMQVARQATSAGIGWAVLNREVEYIAEMRKQTNVPVFSVTVDQGEIGRIQAKQVTALLPQGGLALALLGPQGNSIAEQRFMWLQTTLPDNIQMRTLVGDWSEQSGHKTVSRWLQLKTSQNTPVDVIVGQNDDMAAGAKKAFKEILAGRLRERWTSLPYLGVDCCPGAGKEWVAGGVLTASVVNPPTAGIALELMVKAVQSKSQAPERTVMNPTSYPAIEKIAASPRKPTSASHPVG